MHSTDLQMGPTWEDLGFIEARLSANLAALAERRPEAARFLEDIGPHEALTIVKDALGKSWVARIYRRQAFVIEETPADLEAAIDEAWGDPAALGMFQLGVGTGERVDRRLNRLPNGRVLYVFDPDPGLWALAFSRHDWSEAIRAGRLVPLVGSDLRSQILPPISSAMMHPKMAPILIDDWRFLRAAMSQARRARRKRVAVLCGELMQVELALTLEETGHDVLRIDGSALTHAQIARELVEVAPEAVFSINVLPDLARLCGRLGIDYHAWEIDPCLSPLEAIEPGSVTDRYTHIHTWRRRRVDAYRRAVYQQTSWLPLGAHPTMRSPQSDQKLALTGPVFLGSCMRSHGEALLDLLTKCAAKTPQAVDWRDFLIEMAALREAVREEPHRRDIEDTVGDALRRRGLPNTITTEVGEAGVFELVAESLAAEKRIAVLRALEEFHPVIFGDAEWKDVLPGADYRGLAGHGASLNAIFSQAPLVIDINRIYQPDIVTLRCFEVTACGGLLAAEHSPDLPALFEPGREVLVWNTVSELKDLIRHALAHPAERRAMARAGRERFLAEHTIRRRLETMLG
ncbi:MAG: glycosyltransferase family 1 protein, partial [Salinibacterium sp.]|nr:glycosyltransferase family 1 protein [Salinibacterium sp.]